MSPSQWQHSSQPEDSTIAANDTLRSMYRGRMFWWQYFRPRTPIQEVYPQRSTIQGRSNLSPLYIMFQPHRRGIYNMNPQYLDETNKPYYDSNNVWQERPDVKDRLWGGMQTIIFII